MPYPVGKLFTHTAVRQAVCLPLCSNLRIFLFFHVLSCFDLSNLFQQVSFDTKIMSRIITKSFLIKILRYVYIYAIAIKLKMLNEF